MNKFRGKIIKDHIKESYNYLDHLVLNFSLLNTSVLVNFILAPSFGFLSIPYMLIGFLSSCVIFCYIHKALLHEKIGPLTRLQHFHNRVHHDFFCKDNMTVDNDEQYALVLMPSSIIFLNVFIIYPLSSYLLSMFFWESMVSYMMIGAQIAFIVYEICHWAAHTKDSSWESISYFKNMVEHHREHHLNSHIKFGIASKVGDMIFETD